MSTIVKREVRVRQAGDQLVFDRCGGDLYGKAHSLVGGGCRIMDIVLLSGLGVSDVGTSTWR